MRRIAYGFFGLIPTLLLATANAEISCSNVAGKYGVWTLENDCTAKYVATHHSVYHTGPQMGQPYSVEETHTSPYKVTSKIGQTYLVNIDRKLYLCDRSAGQMYDADWIFKEWELGPNRFIEITSYGTYAIYSKNEVQVGFIPYGAHGGGPQYETRKSFESGGDYEVRQIDIGNRSVRIEFKGKELELK